MAIKTTRRHEKISTEERMTCRHVKSSKRYNVKSETREANGFPLQFALAPARCEGVVHP